MAKPKPVNWQLIEDQQLYQFVQDIIDKHHSGSKNIQGINFVLMWKHNIRQDKDEYIVLADITKSADKYRELRPHDIIIGINKKAWQFLDENQQAALIDTQLERVAVSLDKEGNPKEDDYARTIYRLKRSEVIDNETISRRHGSNIEEIQEYIRSQIKNGGAEEDE